jgi:SSS family solute:Na+ symporter
LIGWAAGLIAGTAMAASTHFQSGVFPLPLDGFTVPGSAALYALALNLVVSIILSPLLDRIPAMRGSDETSRRDYSFDAGEAVGSALR